MSKAAIPVNPVPPVVGVQDDYDLMRAIASGRQEAMSLLYDRYAPHLLALCTRVLHDRAEAEDCLTDVFYEVWTKADRYDPSRGAPINYLTTLARSRAIDRSRSGNKRRAIHTEALQTGNQGIESDARHSVKTPLSNLLGGELREKVAGALSRLDPMQRQAVELSYFEDLSHSEIAVALNKPLGTIKTYIRQGLIRLRDAIRIEK